MESSKHKLKHRFDIIRKLGQGTYGKVQLAINKETGQEVAIKTIKKSKIETEQDAVRIRREIQIMSSIRHPNIVHIYEVFENKDKIVLVMQNASGGELYEYLSERKVLADPDARRIFRQVVAAVYYCHKNKICHRDLKLENILLDEKSNAKIADFGLSNVYDEKNLLSTFCGSPLYASPEIVKGLPYFGPEVDCWSLGVLLYTLVYGAMPFDGSNFKKLVKQISTGDYYEPKQKSSASGLIRHLLTVNALERATIIDVCNHDWVNQGFDTNLLQVAEDLSNLSPVRIDLLLALQPQSPPSPDPKVNGNSPLTANSVGDTMSSMETCDSGVGEIAPSSSLMRMPSMSIKPSKSSTGGAINCLSMKSIPGSPSLPKVPSSMANSSCATIASGVYDDFEVDATASTHSFQAMDTAPFHQRSSSASVAQDILREPSFNKFEEMHRTVTPMERSATPKQSASAANVVAEEIVPQKCESISKIPVQTQKSVSKATIQLKRPDTAPCKVPSSANVEAHPEVSAPSAPVCTAPPIVEKAEKSASPVEIEAVESKINDKVPEKVQVVHIVSRKVEPVKAQESLEVEEPPRSLVWPTQERQKIPGRLSPEGAPSEETVEMERESSIKEGSVPRGLPMKSYKKFTFERAGEHITVREKICKKEKTDGNARVVIEKKVTSRTSSIEKPSLSDGMEGMKIRKGDDSSDEEDFDIHFDSSHGTGLLNVMKFMDHDFRMRWQNHPIFQTAARRPMTTASELLQSMQQSRRRLQSPSLIKMFMDRDFTPPPSHEGSLRDSFESRFHPLSSHSSISSQATSASSAQFDPRGSFRKLNRGSSLDRSSVRVPRTQPPPQMDPMSNSYYSPSREESVYSATSSSRPNPQRYTRTMSDKAMPVTEEIPTPPGAPRVQIRTQQGRPPVVHMELSFNGRSPGSIGLTHSWSNNGLWQQQAPTGTPTRIEMRVHYTTPPQTPGSGMPPRPPPSSSGSSIRKDESSSSSSQSQRSMEPDGEESVSDRINRKSYFHRFSSVERQLPPRPTSTIWDQQIGAGSGILWDAASPDKPLGTRFKPSFTPQPNPTSM